MDGNNKTYRELEIESVEYGETYLEGIGWCRCGSPNRAALARALQARGRAMRKQLAPFQAWLVSDLKFEETTARRKVKLAGSALSDFPGEPWLKLEDCDGERCQGVRSPSYRREIALALERLAEWIMEEGDDTDDERFAIAIGIIKHLGLDAAEIHDRIDLRRASSERDERRSRRQTD